MASRGIHGHAFELTGGQLCLDLANTVDNRPTLHTELLPDYLALVEWARQAGVISESDARRLRHLAGKQPSKAASALANAKRLREAIFRVFSAIANRQELPCGALDELNSVVPDTLGKSRLAAGKSGFTWAPTQEVSPLESIVWWVSRSAVDLLISNDRKIVRECAAPNCSWLFLDRSKNGTRRWCDMKTCGNRDKVRRFRMRHHARSPQKHAN